MKPPSRTREVSSGNVLTWMVSACLDDPQGQQTSSAYSGCEDRSHMCLRLSLYSLLLHSGWKKKEGETQKEIKLQGQECRLLPGTPR